MQKDDITWQSLLYELVRTEQMDPWDIDLSLLSQRYLETIKKLKEFNFFLSGKVILASAILLKIKSDKLLTENIAQFDNYLFNREEELLLHEEAMDFEDKNERIKLIENPTLTIKTPLARKKKVTLQDLFHALQKALEVNERRIFRRLQEKSIPENLKIPEKFDITAKIKEIYSKILNFLNIKKQEKITFTELVSSNRKEDKILTFIPLLHLDNQEKIILNQEIPFGEIEITIKQ